MKTLQTTRKIKKLYDYVLKNTSNTSNLKTTCRVQVGTTYKVRIKFFYEKFNSVV